MENLIPRSSRVHPVSTEVQPLVLERRSNKCSSLRGLVVCDQQRNVQWSSKAISNTLLFKSVTNRRRNNNKRRALITIQHVIFSGKPTLRKRARIIKMGLDSDANNDSDAMLSSKTRGWSLTDNLRYYRFVHIDRIGTVSVLNSRDLSLTFLFYVVLFCQQRIQSR